MNAQAIATLVGLLGVLAGFILFYWGKRLERQAVNIAILAEIRRLINVVCRHKKWWLEECIKTGNTDLPLIPFSTPIYDKQAKNIGLLERSIVAHVASFYGYVQFLNVLQMARAGYIAVNRLPLFEQMYLDALETFCHVNRAVFKQAFSDYGLLDEQVNSLNPPPR
jgi:hypothetical protein